MTSYYAAIVALAHLLSLFVLARGIHGGGFVEGGGSNDVKHDSGVAAAGGLEDAMFKHLVRCPNHPITAMMHPAPVFVAVLAAIRLSGAICFTMVTPRPSSSHHIRHVSSGTRLVPSLPPSSPSCSTTHTGSSMFAPIEARAMSSLVRWQSRLGASGETLGEESIVNPEQESETASSGATNSESSAGVDLSKGIAFEAPKPKALEPEETEEESDSKKVGLWSLDSGGGGGGGGSLAAAAARGGNDDSPAFLTCPWCGRDDVPYASIAWHGGGVGGSTPRSAGSRPSSSADGGVSRQALSCFFFRTERKMCPMPFFFHVFMSPKFTAVLSLRVTRQRAILCRSTL